MAPTGPIGWVEVFVSVKARPARHRALVLRARGIPFQQARSRFGHVIWVPEEEYERARDELAAYEAEDADWPPREPLPASAPGKWTGLILFEALLVLFFAMQTGDGLGLNWLRAGDAHAAAIRGGELWCAMTALTLHTDLQHLLSNMVFGALFGFLAVYSLGGGIGWLGILLAGFLGNWTNAWIQDPGHLSVGASTAVFGAVGILVGSEWRRRFLFQHSTLRKVAPPLIGLLILAYYGIGSPETIEPGFGQSESRIDVWAHVTGLAWGVPLGALLMSLPERVRMDRQLQAFAGLVAVALIFGAWALAHNV